VSNRTVNLETKLLRGILKQEGQWKRLADDFRSLHESGEAPGPVELSQINRFRSQTYLTGAMQPSTAVVCQPQR